MSEQTLSELVQAFLDEGNSQYELERRTGGVVKRLTIRKIVRAGHVPGPAQLEALAEGLRVSKARIRRAAERQREENDRLGTSPAWAVDLVEYRHLNEENKAAVQRFAAALLAQQRRLDELAERIARIEPVAEAAVDAVTRGDMDNPLETAIAMMEQVREAGDDERRAG